MGMEPNPSHPPLKSLPSREVESQRAVVAIAVFDGGIAKAVAFPPFLLALGMVAFERLAAVDLTLVAGLPFAPSPGGQEHADQQPEQEDENADRPKIRVGRDVHCASPTALEFYASAACCVPNRCRPDEARTAADQV